MPSNRKLPEWGVPLSPQPAQSREGKPVSRRGRRWLWPLAQAGVALVLLIAAMWGMTAKGDTQASGDPSGQPLVLSRSSMHAPGYVNPNRPVLAFYYMWYTPSTWCACKMSDLPTIKYNSGDDATIERQVTWAANVGITGFISSWWGAGSATDKNFAKLLAHSAALQQSNGYRFDSTVYFESDAPAFNSQSKIVSGLRYLVAHYSSNANFFHWHGKPVIFFWDPLGQGRTLSMWANVRKQVDPHNATFWSAEGVNMSLLSVFDGIHLFSAGYWGLLNHNMPQVDQGFRAKIDAYNRARHTQKVWAAGVEPGYNDTRVPGRKGTYIVPRNNGATYRTSWQAALSSRPDWVTITTFNEWFEGAMIEPSVHYGNLYLNLTAKFAKQWHG
jgi:Glycosyl hydrolase family 99